MSDPLVLTVNLLQAAAIACAFASLVWLSRLRTWRARRAALCLAAAAPVSWLLSLVAFAAIIVRIKDDHERVSWAAVPAEVRSLAGAEDIIWPFLVALLVFSALLVVFNARAGARLRLSEAGRD